MSIRLISAVIVLCISSTSTAAPPQDAVGPVKPVEIVNESLTIEGSVNATISEPLEIEGNVSVTESDADRFQLYWSIDISASADIVSRDIAIPPGKRIVIEQVSARIGTLDDKIGYVQLLLGPSNEIGGDSFAGTATYWLAMQDLGGPLNLLDGRRTWYLSQKVELWADTFARVVVGRGRSAGSPILPRGEAEAEVSISGRLIDIPAP